VTCYLRRGMTGRAWFDDIAVCRYIEPPMTTMLVEPNYRGELVAGAGGIRLAASVDLRDYDLALDEVEVAFEIADAATGDVVERGMRPVTAEASVLSLPGCPAPGRYTLSATLAVKADGRELQTCTERLTALDAPPEGRAVTVDASNRLIVDGEPYFPLGMYLSGIDEADLRRYAAESAFNCVMPYGGATREQLDLAQELGIKVIYSVKDAYYGSTWCPAGIETLEDERAYIAERTAAYRDHPALLAWYLNDELSVDYMDRLDAHQRWLEELDPEHPTWVVLYQVDQVGQYAHSFDAIGTDPYPLPDKPASVAGDWARKTVAAVRGARPVWMVPQVMDWGCYRKEGEPAGPPTLAEMRCMAWQCVAEGATGLVFYSFGDLKRDPTVGFEGRWADVCELSRGIAAMAPVLLSTEAVEGVQADEAPWLHSTTRHADGSDYVIAVNSEPEPHEAVFQLPEGVRQAEDHESGEALPVTDGRLTVPLEPLEVRVVELGRR
jgi:hypothetical protein